VHPNPPWNGNVYHYGRGASTMLAPAWRDRKQVWRARLSMVTLSAYGQPAVPVDVAQEGASGDPWNPGELRRRAAGKSIRPDVIFGRIEWTVWTGGQPG